MNTTTWKEDVKFKSYPTLEKNADTDVLVIGGGIAGILAAYTLRKEGKKVILVEKKELTHDATSKTTAFLTQSIDTNFTDLIRIFGEEKTGHILDSHMQGIDYIESIIKDESIECDFKRCSNFIYINEEKEFDALTEEYMAGNSLGLNVTLSAAILSGFKNFGFIELKNQAKFHPLQFLKSLTSILEAHGVEIYEHTEITEINESDLSAATDRGKTIHASWIIAATYEPFKQPLGLFFKKGMYTTYVLEATIPHGSVQEGIYEDMNNPYHYFRVDTIQGEKEDTVIIGGEDHRSDLPMSEEKSFASLEEYAKSIFTGFPFTITKKWAGPILEPSDGLALIGPHKNDHILHAIGFSGNGMTYSAISALIMRELITGLKATNEYTMPELYKASRLPNPKSLAFKARDYGEELIHGAIKNTFNYRKEKK